MSCIIVIKYDRMSLLSLQSCAWKFLFQKLKIVLTNQEYPKEKMNNIYTHDFGSLKSESLRIDYIRWNLVSLTPHQIYKSAYYFETLGFNSY